MTRDPLFLDPWNKGKLIPGTKLDSLIIPFSFGYSFSFCNVIFPSDYPAMIEIPGSHPKILAT